ncbi:serine/threonine-protein kinase [Nannocystis sp. SCPEA4]|uniref:serine/threonine-protein kinase n=1 Tax=Nannocystis sp. SCPEA4 TaxID=2996787 RepID=UPI00226DC1D0|nr:serine/threonine-protein kinase [Nannocystis sp. SCPEA4]MCY1059053.1 serine/threonine-protein kinase [Nannocystis sp. SCPEA4]
MECPGEVELLSWLRGTLDRAGVERIETHLDTCASCLTTVAVLGPIETRPADDRYVVGEELARGGMGRVFSAIDRVLDRPVVLKTMRDPAGAARFVREMKITARLQHPAIVTVYDAGTFPDGEPFYVMRHVLGRTLDRAAAEADGLTGRLALLPAVMTAIDAVAYAHECGVIHRDLKPANVLVGRFGETVVVDWGLAKSVHEDDVASAGGPAPAEPGLTRDGTVLGTPAYMAPEQAAGEPASMRSDIYGLGAILYHVLTGAPPAPREPLARREPKLPAELAAIVDRAMARDPGQRYDLARELADDLRQHLAGRLVAAHRYTLAELVRRWAWRHRAALVAATAALVTVVVIGGVAIQRVMLARDEAELARAASDRSREIAETQRAAAEKLVGYVLDVLRARLEPLGRLDLLAGVGTAVDGYYERVAVPDGAAGGEELLRRAEALALLGEAQLALGDLDAAQTAALREEAVASAAVARLPGPASDAAGCRAKLHRGDVAKRRGDLAAARAAYSTCTGDPGPELEVQSLLALADIDRIEGQFDAVFAGLARAEQLAATVAGPSRRKLLFSVSDAIGTAATDHGDVPRARAAWAANLERAERAAEAEPGDADVQHELVTALIEVGRGARRAGDADAARDAFTRAREASQQLVLRDPDNLLWLETLGAANDQLGTVMLQAGDPERALPLLRESLNISERLADRAPRNMEWARGLAVAAIQVGDLHRAREQFAEARASLLRAVEVADRLAAAKPEDLQARRDLAIALLHLGDLERERSHPDAVRSLERAVALLRDLVRRSDTPRSRIDLVGGLLALADAQPAAAAKATIQEADETIAPLRAGLAASPDDVELRRAIADVDEAIATPR